MTDANERGKLTLGRRDGQRIVLTLEDGREIDMVVRDFGRGQVRVDVHAPKTVRIRRGELAPLDALGADEVA